MCSWNTPAISQAWHGRNFPWQTLNKCSGTLRTRVTANVVLQPRAAIAKTRNQFLHLPAADNENYDMPSSATGTWDILRLIMSRLSRVLCPSPLSPPQPPLCPMHCPPQSRRTAAFDSKTLMQEQESPVIYRIFDAIHPLL